MSKKMEINEKDLNNTGVTDKYDDTLSTYNTLTWKDYSLLYMIFGIFVVFIIWANLATVDELTRGNGKIVPSSKIQLIQNLEGGIIDKIFVHEGEIVKAGQPLVKMSNIQAGAEYQANLQRYFKLRAAIARLKAVAEGTELSFPSDLQRIAPNLVKLEQKNFAANAGQQKNQQAMLQQQLDQKIEEVKEIQEKLAGAKKILALTHEEHKMIAPLVKKGTVSKIELLQLKTKLASTTADFNNLKASLAKTKIAQKEAEEKIKSYKSTRKADAQKEISDITTELNSLNETLSAYKDRAKRTEIKSPLYGTVKDIKITTIGGVVQPGEDIMEIVPLNDLLIIEAMISPSDIAFLYPGQEAAVKITAYDYEIYGDIKATLREISADTLTNERGESFYRVKLQSDETVLNHEGKELPIIPGMVASVDILTGKKTIMNYLLSPFKKTLKDSLHER